MAGYWLVYCDFCSVRRGKRNIWEAFLPKPSTGPAPAHLLCWMLHKGCCVTYGGEIKHYPSNGLRRRSGPQWCARRLPWWQWTIRLQGLDIREVCPRGCWQLGLLELQLCSAEQRVYSVRSCRRVPWLNRKKNCQKLKNHTVVSIAIWHINGLEGSDCNNSFSPNRKIILPLTSRSQPYDNADPTPASKRFLFPK